MKSMVSVIIPAYNEENGIKDTVLTLSEWLKNKELQFEIIVINDGSSDHTKEKLKELEEIYPKHLVVVTHRQNRGYGTAIKSGIRSAKGDIIAWYDADGQHRPEDLWSVISKLEEEDLDYVIGYRAAGTYVDKSRVLGKFILKRVINLIAKGDTADFNSGLRAFRASVIKKYIGLLPHRFGASTVTTLIMLEKEYIGEWVPIIVKQRIGKSSVRQFRDGMRTIGLAFEIALLFRPMQIMGNIGGGTILVGLIYGYLKSLIIGQGISVLASIIIITGVQLMLFGLVFSQISKLRLEKYE